MLKKTLVNTIFFVIFCFSNGVFAGQEKPTMLPSQKALLVLGYDIMPADWDAAIQSEIDFLKQESENKNKIENKSKNTIKRIVDHKLINIEGRLCVKNADCLGYYLNNLKILQKSAMASQALWEQIDVLVQQAKSTNPYDGFLLEFYDLLYSKDTLNNNFILLGKALTAKSSLSYFTDHRNGINQTCDNVALGKALMGSNSSHFKKVLGSFFVIGNLNLLNEMLIDSKFTLTKNCQTILKPLPKEMCSFCNTHEELETLVIYMKEAPHLPFLYDHTKLMPMLTKQWKTLCTEEMLESLKNDNPVHPLKKVDFTKSQCAKNMVYCRGLIDLLSPQNNTKTRLKFQDANAYLRLWSQLIDSSNCQLDESKWHSQRHLKVTKDGLVSIKLYGFENPVSVKCPL